MRCITLHDSKPRGANAQPEFMYFIVMGHRRNVRGNRNLSGPQGVHGRNSNHTRLREVMGLEPSIGLEQGLAVTFEGIAAQVPSKPPVSVAASAAAD